ncbi:predicted protein [Naegleria gruberi]|uniref:Predicted protein n=1 Tax=Naegleria gruberi TaxID=5762 RepID=D2V9X1_NAEGR|nr:uncharacterized protein NAEGRDRAFT_47828 [Naegleria gruberi]EFC46322.1 predicted protein [Naegleria gruberi]|eukprot:XP_002679066.1 predicted protein [Naegleria gruberi strain NEG-M]
MTDKISEEIHQPNENNQQKEEEIILLENKENDIQKEEIIFGNDGKYILDGTLCGVGSHLRKLGVDAVYSNEYSDAYILYLARNEDRMIITKSTKLLQRIRQQEEKLENYKKKIKILGDKALVESLVQQRLMKPKTEEEIEEERQELIEIVQEEEQQKYKYYIVKSIGKYDQLKEVVNEFKIIFKKENIFARCFSCNGQVIEVKKEDIEHLVFEKTYLNTDKFTQCQSCNQGELYIDSN